MSDKKYSNLHPEDLAKLKKIMKGKTNPDSKYYKKKSSSSSWLENLKKGIYSRNYQPLEDIPRKGAQPDVEKWNLDQETKNWINKRSTP